jgi:hypothetical protein
LIETLGDLKALRIRGEFRSPVSERGYLDNVVLQSSTTITSSPVRIIVRSTNTPPTISLVSGLSTLEDTATPATEFQVFDLETSAQDLLVTANSESPDVVPQAAVVLGASGTNRMVRLRPAPDQFGVATITLTVQDPDGLTVSTSFELTVTPVNDSPSFTPGPDQRVEDIVGPQTIVGWARDLKAGPPNEADQSLSFLVSTDRPELFQVTPSISPSGTLTFEPRPDTSGVAQVIVRLKDDGGSSNGGIDSSPPVSSMIEITQGSHQSWWRGCRGAVRGI